MSIPILRLDRPVHCHWQTPPRAGAVKFVMVSNYRSMHNACVTPIQEIQHNSKRSFTRSLVCDNDTAKSYHKSTKRHFGPRSFRPFHLAGVPECPV